MIVLPMAFSDTIVFNCLAEMIDKGEPTSQVAISKQTGICIRTIKRSLKRLQAAGVITGQFSPGYGYEWVINGSRKTA